MNTAFIYFLLLFSFLSNEKTQLTINIQDIEPLQGKIMIGIYNSEIGFLGEDTVVKGYSIPADKTIKKLIIKDLPAGEYAISLYHDVNSDGICNRNFMGIPKEPYGFSNNFKPKFSKPKFKDCKFSLAQNLEIDIKLIK